MIWILWLTAVLCVVYYIIIAVYSGLATSFSLIWLFIAALCMILTGGWEVYIKHKDKVPLWVPVSVVTMCCTGILVFAVVEILVFTGVAARDTSNLDYVIVLGAKVKETGITKSLKNAWIRQWNM